jgi:hypothetical protein
VDTTRAERFGSSTRAPTPGTDPGLTPGYALPAVARDAEVGG